jgi:L-ascorbate metabolism protein UlaG (beta-lactamase superfamily)
VKMTHIRNATSIIEYAGKRLLLDPFFADKHALPSFTGAEANPTAELPMPIEDIVQGVDAVLVTHLHTDHFDTVAKDSLPKDIALFCQMGDEDKIREAGFTQVTPVALEANLGDIKLSRTGGHHGLGAVERLMGQVSGFVLQAPDEPTLYIAGDSVLCNEVRDAIMTYQPDIIILNAGGAMWNNPDDEGARVYILMDADEVVQVAQVASSATLVAVHMEALDHCTVSRITLRQTATDAGINDARLRIPDDGDVVDIANTP